MPVLLVAVLVLVSAGSAFSQEDSADLERVQADSSTAVVPPADPYPDRWFGSDKAMHVFAGFWTAGAGYATSAALGGDRGGRRASALAVGTAAGLAKEAFDAAVQGERFSWKDLVADAIGIGALLGLVVAVE